jgi:translation elongation factor EF-1alpha
MHISRRLFLLSFLGMIWFMTPGCGSETFKLKVDDVFYIKTIDRVIVTGSVTSGSVKPGDRLTVRSGGTTLPVTVERLEHPQRKIESAAKGDQVGLVLVGIRKDQVRAGDFVETP